jgi:hypothetical protein
VGRSDCAASLRRLSPNGWADDKRRSVTFSRSKMTSEVLSARQAVAHRRRHMPPHARHLRLTNGPHSASPAIRGGRRRVQP